MPPVALPPVGTPASQRLCVRQVDPNHIITAFQEHITKNNERDEWDQKDWQKILQAIASQTTVVSNFLVSFVDDKKKKAKRRRRKKRERMIRNISPTNKKKKLDMELLLSSDSDSSSSMSD